MRRIAVLGLLLLLLSGCSSVKPFHYHSDREIPPGHGLFSGPDGHFDLLPRERADKP